MKHATSLFIFRRDLRLSDNTGLNNALKQSARVIPCFIFDPRQVEDGNTYKSDNAILFMLESLADLENELHKHNARLYIFYDKAEDVVKELISSKKIDAVFCNRDYTPFSIKRDRAIATVCKQHDIAFEQSGDALLNEPENVLKKDGSHYSIFTAFYNKAHIIPVKETDKLSQGTWFKGTIQHTAHLKHITKNYCPMEIKKLRIMAEHTKLLP